MKKVIKSTMALGLIILASCGETAVKEENTIYTIDSEKSTLTWTGVKIGEEGMHSGTVVISEGTIIYAGTKFEEGNFVVDLNTLKGTDADLPDALKDTLKVHLSSPKWFDMVKFPMSKVVISEITNDAITATINVLGKDIKTVMPIKHKMNDKSFTASGKFDVDFKDAMVPGMIKEGEEMGVSTVVSFELNLNMKK